MAEIKLELTKEEEKGYYSLLAFSQLSIGEFCYYNEFEHKAGLEVLNSLKEKKFVAEVKGLADRYIPQFPFLDIAEKFKEPIAKFTELKANLQTFFDTKEQEIAKSQQEKIQAVNDAINPKISELETANTNLKTETDKKTSELTAEMTSADESYTKTLAESISSTKAEFETNKTAKVNETSKKGSDLETKVLTDSKTFKETTGTVTQDFFKTVDESVLAEIVKEFDALKGSITELNSEIESYESKFKEDSEKWIQESSTKTEEGMNKSKESFSTLVTKSKADVSEEKDALNVLNLELADTKKYEESESALVKPFVDLRGVLTSSKEELDKVRDAFNDKITEIIQADTKNTTETVNASKETLTTSFTTLLETRKQQGESIATQLTETNTTNTTKAQEVVKAEQEKVTQQEEAGKTAITTTKTDLTTKHDEAKKTTQAQIENVSAKILPELAQNVTTWNDSFKTTFDTVTKTTNEQYDVITQTMTEIMAEVKEQYEANAKEITDVTTTTKTTYTKNFTDAMAVMKQKLDEVTAQLQQMHEEWTATTSNTFEDLLNKIHTQLQELVTKQSEAIQTKFSGLQAQVPPKQKESVESFQSVNTQVATEIDNLHKLLETQINGVKSLLENHKQSILTDLPEKVSADLDTLSENIVKHAEGLRTQLDSFLSEWSTTTQGFTDNWVNLEKQLRDSEEASLKESNTGLTAELDAMVKKASGLRVDLITNAKNENKALNETLNTAVDTASTTFSTAYDGMLGSLDGSLDEYNQSFDQTHAEQLASIKQSYDEIKNSLTELLTTTRTNTNTKLKERTDTVTATSEKAQATYKDNKEKSLTTLTTKIDQTFTNLDTTNQTYYKDVLGLQTTFITEIGTILDTFQSSLSDLTINQMKALIASLQEKFSYFNQTQELISTSVTGFIQSESEVRQSLTNGIDEQAKLLQTNLKDHAGEFEKLIKVGEDVLSPPSSVLDRFNGLVTDYDYPKIESMGIIGWSASIVQVQTMIKSMKRRVTLLVPNPDDLDNLMPEIQACKRPKSLDISCQFDLNNKEHVALIRKLLNQDNIVVRNIVEKMGSDSKYPPFLAVDRDAEEVMFGTQDPTNKTAFVGMVSQIENFIQLMGKVVLSDFLSKAKKIMPGDL